VKPPKSRIQSALSDLAKTSKNDRQYFVDKKDDEAAKIWETFKAQLAYSKDDDNNDGAKMKETMKNLTKLLLNSGKDDVPCSYKDYVPVNKFMRQLSFHLYTD
jgi:hypothetical protein